MSDRFDLELKQALKESTTKSLEGWEFTPAMRQAVLQRVAEEESRPAAPVPGSSRRSRSTVTRPLVYAAAAAAVLFVSINMGKMLDGFGGSAKKTELEPLAASMSAPSDRPDVAAKSAPPEATSAERPGAESVADQASATALAAALPPGALNRSAGPGMAKAQATMNQASSARLILQAPPSARADRQVEGDAGGAFGIATFGGPSPLMLQMEEVQPGMTVVLTSVDLRAVDQAGATAWEQGIAGEPALLAVSPSGEIAASTGEQVLLFTAAGQSKGSLQLPAQPTALALGPSERLAAVAGDQLLLYQGAQLKLKADQAQFGQVAFAPDATLALLAEAGEGRQLRLYSPEGAELAQVPVQPGGMGLTFTADGQFVLAAGQLFHRSGQLAWQASQPILGAENLGPSGPLVAWGERELTLLRPADGGEVWTAEFPAGMLDRVAVSASGDLLAVLGSDEAGPVVWVLDRDGGQRYVERLAQMPVDLELEGATLQLLLPGGLESRHIE